jgi:hypothetical protein
MLLQQGNATPHTNAASSALIENIQFEVVPCPPYSPDLALSDFWFFAALKERSQWNSCHVTKKSKLLTGK